MENIRLLASLQASQRSHIRVRGDLIEPSLISWFRVYVCTAIPFCDRSNFNLSNKAISTGTFHTTGNLR